MQLEYIIKTAMLQWGGGMQATGFKGVKGPEFESWQGRKYQHNN